MSILRSQNSDGDLVYSPLEARGRTIYFDWAEYQGGSFRDGQVKCQITSVPGQESLRRRRHLLIEAADAVVFVIDSRPDQMEVNRRSLAELRPWLERNGLAPIDVVYQCNKRDLPGTLGMDEIREELALGAAAEVYESSALQGDGVRIAFVAAVRFGVRQAEILRASNRLPTGTPDIETGEQLLDRVRLVDDPNAAQAEPESAPEPVAEPAPPPQAQPEPAPQAIRIAPQAAPAPPTAQRSSISARAASMPGRPAVMPMTDWAAHRQPAAAPVQATPIAKGKPIAPAPSAAASTAKRIRLPAGDRSRPAVMPMADWLADRAARSAEAERPPTEAAIENADAEILKAMSPGPPAESIDVEAMKVVAAAPTPAAPKRVDPLEPTVLPAPWLPGGEAGVLEAWPMGIWDAIRLSVDPSLDPPKANLEVLQGRIGGGWHARSGGVSKSLEEGRAQSRRLVDWLSRLDDAVSVQRCIVLSAVAEGWRVWQLVRELPTLGMLLQQGLEPGLPSRKAVQILARISTEFVSTCRDFASRNVELPLLLRTLAKEHGKTVYSGFLPNSPVRLRNGDALVQLESELRPLAKAHQLSALNIPETLIELEQLSAKSPTVLPIVELLQSLLIGE
ncbi:MAG TPA: ADP-ribosylation factor-like protein [Thermoanaerobaculia bacterium]|nr:ADP-ribosylation factor-like protein [Thermoanaerobaculia bacterium]